MSGAVPAYGASSWDRGLAVVVHVVGCYFLCLRCPSNTSAADVVVMAAVMVVNVAVGIVKRLYVSRLDVFLAFVAIAMASIKLLISFVRD